MTDKQRKYCEKIAVFMGAKHDPKVQYYFPIGHAFPNGKNGLYVEWMEYHSSWSWQIPVWSKIIHHIKDISNKMHDHDKEVAICVLYESAVADNKPEKGFDVIVEAIEWYENITFVKI